MIARERPNRSEELVDREAEALLEASIPAAWARPAGYAGPCPECGSRTCPGYYKPDGNHFLPF